MLSVIIVENAGHMEYKATNLEIMTRIFFEKLKTMRSKGGNTELTCIEWTSRQQLL